MKQLLIIILSLFIFSCDKEKNDPQKGSLSCTINGSDWTGNAFGSSREKNFGISFTKMKKIEGVEVRWQFLGFSVIKKKGGFQRLYKTDQLVNTNPDSANTCASFNTTQDDGDVSCDSYEVIEADSLTNYIKITREEGNYKEVWGEFSVNFVRKYGCPESTLPDTLRVREGRFHVVLE